MAESATENNQAEDLLVQGTATNSNINSNIEPVRSKEERLDELIPVKLAQVALAPLLGDHVASGMYAISAKPGIGSSSCIPTALYIAGGDSSHVLCLHQDFAAATSAVAAAKRLAIWKSEPMPDIRVIDPTKPNVNLGDYDKAGIIYTTYGSLLYSAAFANIILQWATHAVMDDAHSWSIDQQIVVLNRNYLAGTMAGASRITWVYMTAFPKTFFYDRLAARPHAQVRVDTLRVDVDTPQPRIIYRDDGLGVPEYCNWVKESVDSMLQDKAEAPRRILVFCPTLNSVATLSVKLRAHMREVLFVDPRVPESVDSVQRVALPKKNGHLVILMRPHFGARTYFGVGDVFCPSMNEDIVFDHYVSQPCLEMRLLPADRIAFLESHADAHGARVHHGFSADTVRKHTAPPAWIDGDCIEYYLKAMHAGKPLPKLTMRLSDVNENDPLHLYPKMEITVAAAMEMGLQNLHDLPMPPEFPNNELTADGTAVVEWMLATGLSWTACLAIHKYTRDKDTDVRYTDMGASIMIGLGVLDKYAPPILARPGSSAVGTVVPKRTPASPLATLDTYIDETGMDVNIRARVHGDLYTWHLALEYRRSPKYDGIPGWNTIDSFRLGPFVERIGVFAKTQGVGFQMPTPEERAKRHHLPNYALALQAVTHQWTLAHIARLVCVPITDHDDDPDFWDTAIIDGWDVGSNLMVRLDPAALLDFARARQTCIDKSAEQCILLTYRDMYKIPGAYERGDECLYGVSGLTFMHPNTVSLIAHSLELGPDGNSFDPFTGLAGAITHGLDPNLFETGKVGGRDAFLRRHPSLVHTPAPGSTAN
ncbi:hypothetical protein QBC39DRAFT_407062 [Podospora conica]|nr:hypothetical protein QBC39DRAFT_407062 [Schizothecium conicum]